MTVGSTEERIYDTPVCSVAYVPNHSNLETESQMTTYSCDQILIGELSDNGTMNSPMERVKSGELKISGDVPLCTSLNLSVDLRLPNAN